MDLFAFAEKIIRVPHRHVGFKHDIAFAHLGGHCAGLEQKHKVARAVFQANCLGKFRSLSRKPKPRRGELRHGQIAWQQPFHIQIHRHRKDFPKKNLLPGNLHLDEAGVLLAARGAAVAVKHRERQRLAAEPVAIGQRGRERRHHVPPGLGGSDQIRERNRHLVHAAHRGAPHLASAKGKPHSRGRALGIHRGQLVPFAPYRKHGAIPLLNDAGLERGREPGPVRGRAKK